MFMSYEMLTTFGISAIMSFSLSVILLLVIAAKRGYLRVGASRKMIGKAAMSRSVIGQQAQVGSPLLVAPTAPPLPMIVELTPLKEYPK